MASSTANNAPPIFKGAAVLVLTHDTKILLQQRDDYFVDGQGVIGLFGGGTEEGDADLTATAIRELHEEMGAVIERTDLHPLLELEGYDLAGRPSCVHIFFWHDVHDSMGVCTEGAPVYFNNVAAALNHLAITKRTRIALEKAVVMGFLA